VTPNPRSPSLIKKTLGHYHITGLLGKGGMGEVYRARDTKLDRDVALKVLPADVAGDPVRLERFRREAKTVAGLNHPHIVTLFSVEEDAGLHFLTMELVEGQGLEETLTRDGLPLTQVIDIGISIADALAAAHEKGIVHRDLKPANVRLTKDGRVKVLDFGLAKLSEKTSSTDDAATQTSSPLTMEGTIMGTVPYMSPEQLRGLSVDNRSDIFSLGVMMYEMAAGKRPFAGPTNTDVISSILRDTPTPLPQVKPDIPHQLDRIVSQCLQKDAEERYQSAKDVRNELKALRREMDSNPSFVSGATSAPATKSVTSTKSARSRAMVAVIAAAFAASAAILVVSMNRDHKSKETTATQAAEAPKTIAVLPFANMSGDATQDYFSDGISEDLLNLLAKIQKLRVAARTSSFSFKGKGVGVPEIAKQLNVEYVLDGSVRKVGNQVRVTAQLVHASDGFSVWNETYDRKIDDIFAIQDQIAADVVQQLQIKLLGAAPTVRKTNPEAYALYLQAVQLNRLSSPEGFEQSEVLMHRALAIDSTYVPAWTGLAGVYLGRINNDLMPLDVGVPKARTALDKAVAIDPQYATAWSLRGYLALYFENDLPGAARYMERALALAPNDGKVLNQAASVLSQLGRLDDAIAVEESLVHNDPNNVQANYNLGLYQLWRGQLDQSIASMRTVLSLSPQRPSAHHMISLALLRKGDKAAALTEMQQETNDMWRTMGLAIVYHAQGNKADADKMLNQLIANHSTQYYNIATVYAYRGDADHAFEWLEKEAASGGSSSEAAVDPLLTNIHTDPRWLPYLRKIGFAPEQLQKVKFDVKLPNENT